MTATLPGRIDAEMRKHYLWRERALATRDPGLRKRFTERAWDHRVRCHELMMKRVSEHAR